MNIKWLIMPLAAGMFVPIPMAASAQIITGMQLHEYCGLASKSASELSDTDAMHMNECLFFVDGVIQGYMFGDNNPDLCIPADKGITDGQLGLMVFRYTDQHPERLHIPAHLLVIEAMLNGFHCSGKAPPK